MLGPGHRWPLVLLPLYGMLSLIPSTRESAVRPGLVTRTPMVAALVRSVEQPHERLRIVDGPEIRAARLQAHGPMGAECASRPRTPATGVRSPR